MSKDLKKVISIYIIAFILMIIIVTTQLNNNRMLRDEQKIFFGIKNIWGFLHLFLYAYLGYTGGIELTPLVFIISILWETFECNVVKINKNANLDMLTFSGCGSIDTVIDMTGYLFGIYIRHKLSNNI